jgi:hypothetical protein
MLDHYLPRHPQFFVPLCLLHVRIDSFSVCLDDFGYRKQLKICRILHIRLNTLRLFSEYAEGMENEQKEIFNFNKPGIVF